MAVNITRLRIILRTQRSQAQPLQQRCSEWFYRDFRSQLDRCLGQVEQEAPGALVLDTVRLDLGDIYADRFEQELSKRAIAALTQELALHVSLNKDDAATSLKGAEEGDFSVAESMSNALNLTARQMDQTPDDGLKLLLNYLDTGRLRSPQAWLPPSNPNAWMHTQLDAWESCGVAWQGRIELAWRCIGCMSSGRMAATFNQSVLARLSRWLLTAVPTANVASLSESQAAQWLPLAAAFTLRYDTTTGQVLRERLRHLGWPASSMHGASGLLPDGSLQVDSMLTSAAHMGLRTDVSERWDNQLSSPTLKEGTADGPLSVLGRSMLLTPPLAETTRLALQLLLRQWAPLARPQHSDAQRLRSLLQAAVYHVPKTTRTRESLVAPARVQSPSAEQVDAAASAATQLPELRRRSPSVFPEIDEKVGLVFHGAGIVLLWPVLTGLFEALSLVNESEFIDDQAQRRAVMILDALVWGDGALAPWRLEEFCYWCGLLTSQGVNHPSVWELVDSDTQTQLDEWLLRVLKQVPALDGFDAPAIRALFLQRSGQLKGRESPAQLTVDAQAQDILLRDFPWPLSHLTLPWLSQVITINWLTI